MKLFDEMFYDSLKEHLSLKKVATKLIARQLAKQGITLNDEQLEKLEERLENIEESDSFTFDIEDLIPGDHQQSNLIIDLDDSSETDKLFGEIIEKITNTIPDLTSEIADNLLKQLKSDAPKMLEEHKVIREGFEARLFQKWGQALNLLTNGAS
jgi:hypothetical protein